jgi:hypothetical protein
VVASRFLLECFDILLICVIFAGEMRITKKRYLQSFLIVTVVLAIVRLLFPSIASERKTPVAVQGNEDKNKVSMQSDTSHATQNVAGTETSVDDTDAEEVVLQGTNLSKLAPSPLPPLRYAAGLSPFFKADGSLRRTPIYSVPGYQRTFEDQQDVQLVSASRWGIKPVQNREEAVRRKSGLVYVGSNPYVYIDKLHSSIPYLVPRASVLLQDIGRSYFDSLTMKGIPLHKIIVTSVLRSKDDVERLRGHNGNATQNSCHLYGTTFDVCYNRYKTVEPPGEQRHAVRNDTLKYILAEVLRDMREEKRCYVKYEVNQGCFHITVR